MGGRVRQPHRTARYDTADGGFGIERGETSRQRVDARVIGVIRGTGKETNYLASTTRMDGLRLPNGQYCPVCRFRILIIAGGVIG